jgi:hypothetical protein
VSRVPNRTAGSLRNVGLPRREDSRELDRSTLTAAALCVGLIALGLHYAFGLPLNHDAAWFLHMSREVLDGARLYTDIIEVNPPLIIWLGIPVILLERMTGVSHTALFPAVVALGAVVSLLATHRLSRHVLTASSRPVYLAAAALVLFVLPAREWGQREHVLLLLTIPFITACAARAKGRAPSHGWLIGLLAGFGFALKPHFLFAFVGLEAWLLLLRRPLWTGTLAAGGVVAAYGLVVIVFTGYLPLVWGLRDVYGAYVTVPALLLIADVRVILVLAALCFVAVPGDGRELRTACAIGSGAGLVAFITQGKGFDYHLIPALAGAVCLVVLAAAVVFRSQLALAAAGAAVLLTGALAAVLAPPSQHVRWAEIAEVRRLVPGTPTVLLTPSLPDVWPHISYAGARWSAPIPSVWPILTHERGRLLAASWIAPAIEASVPVLVPVDPRRSALPALLQHPALRAAWAEYEPVRRGQYYELFEVRQ